LNPDVCALFPGASERVCRGTAARGLIPPPARDAIDAHLRMRLFEGGDKGVARKRRAIEGDDIWALVERARRGFAELIRADANEIAITKNVSEGLNLFAGSLPWEPGDNVVVCPALGHPNNVYLWYMV
jgi:selenocysteine lyase/cysteine desulfurase